MEIICILIYREFRGRGIFSIVDHISYIYMRFDECTRILILDQLLLSLGNTFIGVTDNHLGKDLFQSMIHTITAQQTKIIDVYDSTRRKSKTKKISNC